MKFILTVHVDHAVESHPARGAWIEIVMAGNRLVAAAVAPRKGCVD